jgi:hypothetical protein
MKLFAILLIIAGVLVVGFQGFTYVTREKVVDLGPIEVTRENEERVFLPPLIGALVLAGGLVLLIANSRRA